MSQEKIVPCNGCTVCCQKDLIFLKPHLGDNISEYEYTAVAGRYLLKHKDNGDCIYLDRHIGCTIHERRPVVCREFDCRFIFDLPRSKYKEAIRKGLISKKIVKAAKRIR